MSDHDAYDHTLSLSYSPTARDAFGVMTDYMPADDAWFHAVTYNHLLARRNGEASQANLYALTGAGTVHADGREHAAASLGLAADWETRRLYASYENRYLASDPIAAPFNQKARIGVAPWLRPYESIQPWLMLQIDHRPGTDHAWSATPFIRLLNGEWLGEVGISNHGDVLTNLTYQF